jgi:GNAT superfamily N-acetyltransferase
MNTASVVVRVARPADLPTARGVVLAAYWQYARIAPARVFPTYLADVLDLEQHSRSGPLLVIEVDGRMLAVVTFQPDARVQSLGWPAGWASGRGLAVHPAARGLGLARVLLVECERRAREAGAPVFAFHTGSFMTGAQQLYDQLGYQRIPEFDVDIGAHYAATGVPSICFGSSDADRHLGLAYGRELTDSAAASAPLAA